MPEGVYWTGYKEIEACTRVIGKRYENAGRFRIIKGEQYYDVETGLLRFDRSKKFKARQRKVSYGWDFAHDSVILENSVDNLQEALIRLMCVRKPEIFGLDAALRNSQRHAIDAHRDLFKHVLNRDQGFFWHEDLIAAATNLVPKPHVKKKLRISSWKDCGETGLCAQKAWIRGNKVIWKQKMMEWAKNGKIGRIVVDLGCPASLQGADIAEAAKEFLSKPRYHRNCKFEYIKKSDYKSLYKMFKEMQNNPYRFVLYAYSDDAVAGIYDCATGKFYDLDISSCDTSHTSEFFELMFDVFNFTEAMREVFRAQIRTNCGFSNPGDRKEKVVFSPLGLYLQSGSTLTTLINTFAWLCMFCLIAELDDINEISIVDTCARFGYIVTIKEHSRFEQCTFLKHNPVRCECCQEYQPVINLGTVFRASGIAKYMLPGKGNIVTKAYNHQSGVMNGLLGGISNDLIQMLNPMTTTKVIDVCYHSVQAEKKHIFSDANLFARYDFTQEDITQLRQHILNLGLGRTCYSRQVDKIYQRDYDGMRTPLVA